MYSVQGSLDCLAWKSRLPVKFSTVVYFAPYPNIPWTTVVRLPGLHFVNSCTIHVVWLPLLFASLGLTNSCNEICHRNGRGRNGRISRKYGCPSSEWCSGYKQTVALRNGLLRLAMGLQSPEASCSSNRAILGGFPNLLVKVSYPCQIPCFPA